jgi:RNA polymerase sigma-70 factor, ECF subfamily
MTHADLFLQYRSLLFGIAYRMLGSLEAEDIVQDAFLQFQKLDLVTIANPRGLLVTIDYLNSARVQREQYIGPWLPEPLVTEDSLETLVQKETLSVAFLLMLESLTPVERAVFLLRDVFDFDYADIADLIDKSPQYCRQLAHRARLHINERRSRSTLSVAEKEGLFQRFLAACEEGNIAELVQVLAEDCQFYSDGGGNVAAALKPIQGRDRVITFLFNILKQMSREVEPILMELNGTPGVMARMGDRVEYTLTVEFQENQIVGLYSMRNPEKLNRVQ